jgi:hypothetical protein
MQSQAITPLGDKCGDGQQGTMAPQSSLGAAAQQQQQQKERGDKLKLPSWNGLARGLYRLPVRNLLSSSSHKGWAAGQPGKAAHPSGW